jgi:hypothetical protein
LFAAQVALPDEENLEYIYGGYDVGQIARAMCSDINLVALKVSELNTRGTLPRTGTPEQLLEMNEVGMGWTIDGILKEQSQFSTKTWIPYFSIDNVVLGY